MKVVLFKKIVGGLLSFSLFFSLVGFDGVTTESAAENVENIQPNNQEFASFAKNSNSNFAQVEQDPFATMMNTMMGIQGGGQNDLGSFDIQSLLADLQKNFEERLRQEFEEKLELLPEKYKKLFKEQEGNFENVNNVLQLENHIVDVLIRLELNLEQINKIHGKAENISKEILEVLSVTYFCLEKGYVNTFIQNGFLRGISNKVGEVTNFVAFNQKKFRAKVSRGPEFTDSILKLLKEYSEKIDLHKTAFIGSDDYSKKIYTDLDHLKQILLSFVESNFKSFLNICLQYLKSQVDVASKSINLAYLSFENHRQNLSMDNVDNKNDEQIKVFEFFINKLNFYKKALDNFYSYKKSLNIQKNIGYQFFYKSLLYTYDFFGRLEKYLPSSKFFTRKAPLRGAAAMAYFFDAYMLSKGVSLLDVLKGNADLKNVAQNKMALQILAMLKSVFIMFSTRTFSFDKIWMVGSIMQLAVAFTYYHFFKDGGGQEFWPNNDGLIKGAISSILKESKKSASRFVEGFVWSLNPEMIEKVEDKTFGIVGPDLVGLMFDLFSPSLVNDHFPASIANFRQENPNDFGSVARNMGATSKHFIEIKHPLNRVDMNNWSRESIHNHDEEWRTRRNSEYAEMDENDQGIFDEEFRSWQTEKITNRDISFSNAQLNALDELGFFDENGRVLRRLEAFKYSKNPEWYKFRWKKIEKKYVINGVDFSIADKKKLDSLVHRPKYTKAEFIEGKIVGYIFSQFGRHYAKSLAMKHRSMVGRVVGKIVDSGLWFFNKIGFIYSPKEEIKQMKEEFAQSMGMLKGILVNMLFSTKDSSVIGPFLYNAAGLKLLSYAKAARFFKLISNNMNNMVKLQQSVDALFDAIADQIYGNIAGWVGSKFMLMLGTYTMNKWGPFYPRIRGAF